MPEVGYYNSPEVNAFATGPSKRSSLVAVSSGLLQTMKRDEVEGVLAHEIAHIENGDMVTMTLIQGVVNAFVMFFARIIANVARQMVDEKNSYLVNMLVTIALDILLGILGMMIVAWFSRAREFRADAGGARLAGKPADDRRPAAVDADARARRHASGLAGHAQDLGQARASWRCCPRTRRSRSGSRR